MAKFQCKCGMLLSNTSAPNDVELKVYTDKEWDYIINLKDLDILTIPRPRYDVWHCKSCDRIHVFIHNELIKTYKVEE